jgi:hypothetical protein
MFQFQFKSGTVILMGRLEEILGRKDQSVKTQIFTRTEDNINVKGTDKRPCLKQDSD